ncbi:MAG: TerB family tellurite resistance protein [Flavobacteriaceae bacterium]|nr:TerB family tellurite resistance protein [Flavobacteriaceae bacterium]
MDLEYKLSLISDLIVLAKADDKVTSHEYDFMYRLAERMEISKEQVDHLFENPKPSQPIFSELERITHFHKLLLMMNVDRETHEKEIHVLREFGLKMGIRPGAIDQILVRMNDYEDKLIPAQELISIFQTYYN